MSPPATRTTPCGGQGVVVGVAIGTSGPRSPPASPAQVDTPQFWACDSDIAESLFATC